jgi:hypothetical protein
MSQPAADESLSRNKIYSILFAQPLNLFYFSISCKGAKNFFLEEKK